MRINVGTAVDPWGSKHANYVCAGRQRVTGSVAIRARPWPTAKAACAPVLMPGKQPQCSDARRRPDM